MGWRRGIVAVVVAAVLIGAAPGAGAAEDWVHVLLIGADGTGEEACRADTVLLCSFRPGTDAVVLTSFLRDLYIPIPGHGSNRLNAAYALGGEALLRRTLERQFGLTIRGCVRADFTGFPRVIDALGGAKLNLRQDEADLINECCSGSMLTAGEAVLNGEQALCFVRIRVLDADGDFSRTRRQQRLLRSLLGQAQGWQLVSLARQVLPLLRTDIDPVQLLGWGLRMAPQADRLRVHAIQIPAPGTYRASTVRGMAVLEADWEENASFLRQTLAEAG